MSMPTSPKIITKLLERRQIEADLHEMLAAGSEREFQRRAWAIASLGTDVVPVIINHLADPNLLPALGLVAAYLDPEIMSMALRQATLQPHRTHEERLAAVTILERFLGEEAEDLMPFDLGGDELDLLALLDEILTQPDGDPSLQLDLLQRLDQQEPDTVLGLVWTLKQRALTAEDTRQAPVLIDILRMMAQDVRSEIAQEALQVLGTLRFPEAAYALQTLEPIVQPELRSVAERALRRLRFSRVAIPDQGSPSPDWRALLSPTDGLGQQSVWFILEQQGGTLARFLNVLLNDRFGAVETAGHGQVPTQILPPSRPLGHLHDIALPDGSGAVLMVEIPFDVGRRMVRDALAQNWETQIPVAASLRLLSPWLWEASGADALPLRALPVLPSESDELLADSDRLLDHPAFSSWTLRGTSAFELSQKSIQRSTWSRDVMVRRVAGELFADAAVRQVFGRRLELVSEWFLWAADERRAQQALAVSRRILVDPQDLPFIQALIRRDLSQALEDSHRWNRMFDADSET